MWERCWSIGRGVLQLSNKEFYALTPRQYHLLLDRHEKEVEHNEFLFGQLCATFVNWSMHSPKESLKATDFMPSKWLDTPTVKRRRKPSAKVLAAQVKAAFSSLHLQP
jgi:hypothetical protein